MQKRVTISTIAQQAGVSKGAAWAALSSGKNNVRLAPETRERILEIARELDYRPNIMAKGLNCRKSFLLGFFFSESNWYVSAQLIRSIQHVCSQLDYSVIVFPSSSLEEERHNLKTGFNRQLDGILAIPFISDKGNNAEMYNSIASKAIPVVQIIFRLLPEIPFVGRDHLRIGSDAVDYLVERGHRHIGLLTFSNYKDPVQGAGNYLHHQGYKEAMTRAGLPAMVYPVTYGAGRDSILSGYEIAEEILASPYEPTALIASANSLSYGAMARFGELGVAVPGDISMIGCADDLHLPGCLLPQLTAFPVTYDAIGKMAAEKCLGLPNQVISDAIYLKQEIAAGATVAGCEDDEDRD